MQRVVRRGWSQVEAQKNDGKTSAQHCELRKHKRERRPVYRQWIGMFCRRRKNFKNFSSYNQTMSSMNFQWALKSVGWAGGARKKNEEKKKLVETVLNYKLICHTPTQRSSTWESFWVFLFLSPKKNSFSSPHLPWNFIQMKDFPTINSNLLLLPPPAC